MAVRVQCGLPLWRISGLFGSDQTKQRRFEIARVSAYVDRGRLFPRSPAGPRPREMYLNESYFQKRGVCTYTYVQTSPAPPAAMCMGGGPSIVRRVGLRELRLEGLAADERVLVRDGPDDSLAPVPHQGVPDGDDFRGDGGGVDVVADPIAANIL